jgi:cytidine deaminase
MESEPYTPTQYVVGAILCVRVRVRVWCSYHIMCACVRVVYVVCACGARTIVIGAICVVNSKTLVRIGIGVDTDHRVTPLGAARPLLRQFVEHARQSLAHRECEQHDHKETELV